MIHHDMRPLTVAIILFNGVELLDFAGPFEVFGVTNTLTGAPAFEVFTVALDRGQISARNGLRISPDCLADDIGGVDVLVVPGGYGTRAEMRNKRMLDFVSRASTKAGVTLSICTGALILGAASLLRGLPVTTHHGALDELKLLDCGEILPNARVVDNGSVVVCAGISAGIDGALLVVSRLFGLAVAEQTASYMEYDWRYKVADGQKIVCTTVGTN